jgi:hypothetical protein
MPLNLPGPGCDKADRITQRDSSSMQSIRPDNTDPIPLRHSPPRMGIIMIRFVGLLVLAVVVLALVWSQ